MCSMFTAARLNNLTYVNILGGLQDLKLSLPKDELVKRLKVHTVAELNILLENDT